MERPLLARVVWPGLLVALLCASGRAQESTFRSGTEMVPVYVTVIGADGRLVTDLTRDDFRVLDNGREQPLTFFDAGRQPISIIVMLDMSGSMLGNLGVLRNAAVQMFTRLEARDRARVGNFGDRIVISPTFTNDVDDLIRSLWFDLEPGGNTPLWGAVNASMAGLSRVEGRRVVLVLSDGKNTVDPRRGSYPTLEQVIARAQRENFMVYGIGMRSRDGGRFGRGGAQTAGRPGRNSGGLPPGGARRGQGSFGGGQRGQASEPDPGLAELAHESGGGYFELDQTADLGHAFARVADELHQQYMLGFSAPESDGKVHTIQVMVRDSRLTARARGSYQAPRPPSDRR